MPRSPRAMTRRQLLRAAGVGAAGLAGAGALGELLGGAGASRSAAGAQGGPFAADGGRGPQLPDWRTRPDLRIPALTVERRAPGASQDPIFIAPYNAPEEAQAGAVITDAAGEPIWENPVAHRVTTNFRVQSYRGSPVLTWWEGSIELGHGIGEYVIADTSYRTIRRVQAERGLRGDLHEFVITPRGTALLTTYLVTKADLTSVGGGRHGSIQDAIFQEIDLASGSLLMEWHSLDHVLLEESYAPVSENWDFFHINSVDLDTDGNLLVSGRSMHTVYKVARDGEILWRLGGKRNDFEMGPGTAFAWQHDARRQPDGTLTLFDNGAAPAVEPLSRALILDLDERALRARLVHQYTHAKVLSGSQGSVQLLPGGNVFVGWGETPRVSEYRRSGELVFDAVLGSQYECYRAFRLPWRAVPAERPAVAIAGAEHERAVYASWNGATDVHSWQLLAGEDEQRLRPVARARATGFETALPAVRRIGPLVAVRALDRAGAALGRSPTITVS
jgi:hypothetical protein